MPEFDELFLIFLWQISYGKYDTLKLQKIKNRLLWEKKIGSDLFWPV